MGHVDLHGKTSIKTRESTGGGELLLNVWYNQFRCTRRRTFLFFLFKRISFFQNQTKGMIFGLFWFKKQTGKFYWKKMKSLKREGVNGNFFVLCWKHFRNEPERTRKNKRNGKNSLWRRLFFFFFLFHFFYYSNNSVVCFLFSFPLKNVKETSSRTSKLTDLIKHLLSIFLEKSN